MSKPNVEYAVQGPDADGRGEFDDGFTVKAGSKVRSEVVPSASEWVRKTRKQLLSEGVITEERRKKFRKPDKTERSGLVTSRVGQGFYRQQVIEKWGGRCPLTGIDIRPILNGVEWQALMRMAGYEPRVSIDAKEIAGHKRRTTSSKYIYTHYCPRCKIKFIAGRTDRRWRCESCSREKQPGVLLVSKRLRD